MMSFSVLSFIFLAILILILCLCVGFIVHKASERSPTFGSLSIIPALIITGVIGGGFMKIVYDHAISCEHYHTFFSKIVEVNEEVFTDPWVAKIAFCKEDYFFFSSEYTNRLNNPINDSTKVTNSTYLTLEEFQKLEEQLQ